MKRNEVMEDSGAQTKSFYTCKNALFAGGCRCKVLGGANECLLEKNQEICPYYEQEDE